MKKIFYITLLILSVGIYSCTDLEEEVLDEQNGSAIIADSENVGMLVAPAYTFLRDLQSRGAGWLALETCTDEVAFPTRGANWNSSAYRNLFTHDYDASNSYIKNTWNSYLIGFARCNVALYYMDQLEKTDEINEYIAEVRFVRVLSMYLMNDCFGKMPYREYTEYDYAADPEYYTRAQIVAKMISELEEIIPELAEKGGVPYGRVTRGAAQTLLAKIYLNYQVYTGTAPEFTDGDTKWDETISTCDDIINSGLYSLADDYWKLFLADNADYMNSTETILPIVYDSSLGIGGIPWVNMTLDYNQAFGTYSTSNLWNGCCTTPTFYETWDQTDPRFSDDRLKSVTGFNLGLLVGQQYSTSGEALVTKDGGRPLIFTPEFSVENSLEEEGVRVVKYAPDAATSYPGASQNDWSYYRLADVYLMRAEAKFRKGDTGGALTDINTLRSTRGATTLNAGDLSLEAIYNERGYELYWENSRRNDMIRFNKYCEARYEKEEVTDTYKILFPVPLTAYDADKNITQNPGYDAFN
ncbi:RagB/SusD family nutrient uptake outer membrane protein [Mangrovibacterium diazotrophicum]|uniref:Putative outer membrane starch-binding protein n=1 Tax=Mangrovibacterium diazotrophicum TaxID=1261403 RepID=A0A419W461_9BACT|nr:RagB/SusD family nutrient uptake outer membrane protein [Mangrovibacterium diazotrophicum]RKD90238.1 putative outer membrane starch-binding protein [Mangrovibacterium diazotrophicum]